MNSEGSQKLETIIYKITRGPKNKISLSSLIIVAITASLYVPASYQDDSAIIVDELTKVRIANAQRLLRESSAEFGREIYHGTQEVTCLRTIRDRFSPTHRGNYRASIESIQWINIHDEMVKTISNTMGWHKNAVEAIARASEELAFNHTFIRNNFTYDYIDVHRLMDIDEAQAELDQSSGISNPTDTNEVGISLSSDEQSYQDTKDSPPTTMEPLPKPDSLVGQQSQESKVQIGEWETPIKFKKLSKHKNFGDIPINTEESVVHIPVHIYPGEPQVMNGIAWSDGLTKVFRDNFVRNPKLTNQYFASQSGFMRLFPGQKWQIPRMDPDLYDARMRPWYLAGATSRKDVLILVDSSGSMTGTRRDIARGVVFEILDTLTDNDNFLILKFSDSVQQVGVPACSKLRPESSKSGVPPKNTLYHPQPRQENDTDIGSFFFTPATGRNIRHVKTNFTLSTSGIANFSKALVAAFEVLRNYQDTDTCNQAIMLITDGSPSVFEDIFNRYNYPNAPYRLFTYLIGREAGDVSHTKMMACHNRGYYAHVINLAEVRETVQQYIPVMARPLVLSGHHPITWTPAYGELTYQVLTDWIWESKRREKARSVLANSRSSTPGVTGVQFTNEQSSSDYESYELSLDQELDAIDLFGYNSNPSCYWQTRRNDLLTTVVQPVYDLNNRSNITERFLLKNVWTVRDTEVNNARILGVAAADMKINDIIALAPSHKLGPNGYAIMLTNNGFAMHHPNLRSILELDEDNKNMKLLKPHFSSMDLSQVEHVHSPSTDNQFIAMRNESVSGLTGWRELYTKRTLDCNRRVQTRRQIFYFKKLEQFPFSFMISIPQPYGSHQVKAQIEIKNAKLPDKLTTYFNNTYFDLWTVHPDYQYCEGPSNITIATLMDVFQRIDARQLDDIQWKPAESKNPPIFLPNKFVCDKDLVQSLVYDAFAIHNFSNNCGSPNPSAKDKLLSMLNVRFSFVATRSGLTRVRHFSADDETIKKEAHAFVRKFPRAADETFYSRTVDYNMLINEEATLVQVPFNTHEKIRDRLNKFNSARDNDYSSLPDSQLTLDGQPLNIMSLEQKLEILTNSSLHVISTQSIIVKEGDQRAVAGVAGSFYDYASFVLRFFNSTNDRFSESRQPSSCIRDSCDESKASIKCGLSNDTIDCLLIDNNGYIVVSELLDYIGRHLKAYDPIIMQRLVEVSVFHEVNITDYQSICIRYEQEQQSSNALSSLFRPYKLTSLVSAIFSNLVLSLTHVWTIINSFTGLLIHSNHHYVHAEGQQTPIKQQLNYPPTLPSKTYLSPCDKLQTLYETRAGKMNPIDSVEHYTTGCNSPAWFTYEQLSNTNLIMLVVDSEPCKQGRTDTSGATPQMDSSMDPTGPTPIEDVQFKEDKVCSVLERETKLYRKKLDSCYFRHPGEEQITLCGSAFTLEPTSHSMIILTMFISILMINVIV